MIRLSGSVKFFCALGSGVVEGGAAGGPDFLRPSASRSSIPIAAAIISTRRRRARLLTGASSRRSDARSIGLGSSILRPIRRRRAGVRNGCLARCRIGCRRNPALGAIIEPTLQVLEAARAQLLVYDRAVIQRARSDDTARQLMSAPGVGTVVALAYMTGVEDPARFKRSSSVAAYFGMTPRRYQSGEVDHAGRISKCGDGMVRGLLFEAAKVLLGRSSRPNALKTWGEALGKRIGLKKATMAVARKLAVILHRMWTTGATFQWNAGTTSSVA